MNLVVKSWVLFIGVVLLLLGAFGTLRTAANLILFQKYPTSGVLNFSFVPTYSARESDCYYVPTPTYDPSGKPIPDSEDKTSKLQQENCLRGMAEERQNAKVNDISKSLLFLFLGLGILGSTKYLGKLS